MKYEVHAFDAKARPFQEAEAPNKSWLYYAINKGSQIITGVIRGMAKVFRGI